MSFRTLETNEALEVVRSNLNEADAWLRVANAALRRRDVLTANEARRQASALIGAVDAIVGELQRRERMLRQPAQGRA